MMDAAKKKKYIDKVVRQMRRAVTAKLARNQLEAALKLAYACAEIEYDVNQFYSDEVLENCLTQIGEKLLTAIREETWDKKRILFYDGFGYNNRGLAQIYLKGLCKIGHVIYVAHQSRESYLPDVLEILQSAGADVVWLKAEDYVSRIRELHRVFLECRPGKSFLYTIPNDVAALTVFEKLAGQTVRYQVNLTDHAFWLGRRAFDYCIEFRDYGASVSRQYRKIPEEKLIKLPFYPVIDRTKTFEGYPFNSKAKKIVFSGGALYKTLGGDNQYYKIVDYILKEFPEAVFWYAGGGDRTEMDKLIATYPDRVHLTAERGDLFQVLQRCFFYLSTYPLCGGLMFQYAASAGKVPVTLKYSEVSDDFLLDQQALGVEFETMDEVKAQIRRLFTEEDYRLEQESRVSKAVVDQASFEAQLKNIVESACSDYAIRYRGLDTAQFLSEYLVSIHPRQIRDRLTRKKNIAFAPYLPMEFLLGILSKVKARLFG